MKPRVKTTAFTLTITVLLALNFFQTAFAPPSPIGDPAYLQKECFDSNPTTGTYDQVGTPTGAIENAFDGVLDTNINFQYGAGDGYVQVSAFKRPSDNGLVDFSITFVDLKIHYRAGGIGTTDDRYRIVAYVDPSATPIVLQDWVTGTNAAYPPGIPTNPGIRVFSNVSEPNDGVWDWADLAGLRVRFEINQVGTNNFQRVYEHEVWVTAYSTPYPEPGTMSVQTTIIGGLTAGDLFYVDIYVTNVEDFWGYEFVLTFDPTVLAGIEYLSYGPFVSSLPSVIGEDYVAVAYKTYDGDPTGFTGSTPVARIYFVVVADGTSTLTLVKATGANVFGNTISFVAKNGVFASSPVRDVAVIDVKVSPFEVRAGESVEIDAVVANQGTSSETFDVTAFYDSTSIGTQTVTDLGSGSTVGLNFVWNTAGVAVGLYQIRVEADVVPDETDTADNTFTDGTVSVLQPSQYTRLYLPNQWITNGVAMGWHADDYSWPYTLPFDFPFYGTYYRTIYISSNGLITFTGPDSSFSNSIDALAGKLAIAVAWDDLATYEPRDIFIWQSDSTHVIIRWYASPLYNTALTVDFEAILSANGVIQFNYGYNDGSISATVGISNGVGDIIAEDITNCNYANTILFTPYIPEHDLSVHLEAPWYLLPGQSTILNATVDNLGSNDELEVELELRINDDIAGSVVIPELISGSSYTLSQEWTPTAEGTYNVTAYALPVPDEEYTGNNVASVDVRVRFVIARVAVLNSWDIPGYFTGGWGNDYQPLVDALNVNGFHAQAVTNEEIIGGILSSFDVFVMVDNVPNEAAVPYVVAFWSSGGGVVAFDSSICFLNYAGILPPESAGSNGAYAYWDYETSNQARVSFAHPITAGYEVGQILYGTPGDAEYRVDVLAGTSAYPYYAMLVEDVTRPNRAYVSAYEPPSSGNVVHIWDQRHWFNTDLQSMILNAMEWAKAPQYEHDLAVSLIVPAFLRLGYPTMLSAAVRNRGLNNENNVELYLLINGAVVDSVLIPELLTASSYTLSYSWTPTIEGNNNITAYAAPVPNEADTTNNQATRFVAVVSPLINPVEGQWANYTISIPYGQMLLNASYSNYLSPTQMHVDLWLKDYYGNTGTYWLVLNIMNRQVEEGIWAGYWYPLWIEPDVTMGSVVNIFDTNGTVTTSRFIEVGDFIVECWGLQFQYYSTFYTFWFDKAHGLVIAVDGTSYYNYTETWRLTATNVPLNYLPRIRIQTNPRSGPVGTEVTITSTSATPNGSVEIYWDNTLVGTITADESGNFVFTFAVTPCTMGPHSIMALDLTTNVTDTSVFIVVPSISIAPLSGPMGSRIEVTGLGFGVNEPVVLCFDDMQIGTVYTDDTGSFTATVNIPISQSGLHLIKAWYGTNYAHATFTVSDVSPLDVNMEVGAIYFKGETVEFYVQTVFKGRPVDVTSMTYTLYMPDGTTQALTYERIATGLYRIRYTVSGKGSMTGTYTLVVEASYVTDTVNAYGTSITTFIVKPTWEKETTRMAALSVASIGLVSAMILLWRREKKQLL